MKFSRFSLFFFSTLIFSCSDNSDYLPGYSGNIGEIVVVMDQKHWGSASGEILENTLSQAQYGLPQDEPIFNLIQISSKDFGKIFQTHRNILLVDFSEKETEVKSEIKLNSWAKGQLVIKITAPEDSSFVNFIKSYSENILRQVNDKEIQRQTERNKKLGEKKLTEQIIGKYPFSVVLEKDCYIAKEDSNFLWIRLEKGRNLGGYEHQISKGILIYWYDYADTLMLSFEKLIAVKDSIGKKHISGTVPGSYMATSYKLMPPQAKKIKHQSGFAVEIRGLWRMENDFMGGPFISLTMVDEKRNKIITAEGYVYAPQFDKLTYLREVEAMVKSIYF